MAGQPFNIFIIGQSGRLQYEAVMFAASLQRTDPDLNARLYIGEPAPGRLWDGDPRISGDARALLQELGATFVEFEAKQFGKNYPQGNKIEGLRALPKGEPFIVFDTDTLITGPLSSIPFNFARPTASMRREGSWPVPELYGPGYAGIWKSLYDRFGLDFDSSVDPAQPDEYWRRYLYFSASWFLHSCPHEFGDRFLTYALEIIANPPEELACQTLWPWLDQITLPLVIHSLGGGRPGPELDGLDGDISCHYRHLPLLYAQESDAAVQAVEDVANTQRFKKVLREYKPVKTLVYQGKGQKIRAMFNRNDLPPREQMIRNAIKREGLWAR